MYYHNITKSSFKQLSRTKLSDNKFKKEFIKSPLILSHEVETYVIKLRRINPGKCEETDDAEDELKNNEPSNTCVTLNLSEEEFCNESTTTTKNTHTM